MLFGDGSVGRIYGSNSAFFLRPTGAVGGVHAGVEFSEGQVVDARMDREASFERAEVLTKRVAIGAANAFQQQAFVAESAGEKLQGLFSDDP